MQIVLIHMRRAQDFSQPGVSQPSTQAWPSLVSNCNEITVHSEIQGPLGFSQTLKPLLEVNSLCSPCSSSKIDRMKLSVTFIALASRC